MDVRRIVGGLAWFKGFLLFDGGENQGGGHGQKDAAGQGAVQGAVLFHSGFFLSFWRNAIVDVFIIAPPDFSMQRWRYFFFI
jgi:hypothetical protein